MFGTVARYRVKQGREDTLLSEMKRFEGSPPEGWLHTTVFRSTADTQEIWLSVVFESEESYRRNADSADMDEAFRRLRENLESDPEWHDGHVIHDSARQQAHA